MKNKSKWASYKLAYEHIDAAIKQGFYIEALALAESIISDRLESAVKGKEINTKNRKEPVSFAGLIQVVEENPREFKELHVYLAKKHLKFDAVDVWRKNRNKFVHNVVRGLPGQARPVPASEYDSRGKEAAETGKKLARLICDWSKSELRALKTAKKTAAGSKIK